MTVEEFLVEAYIVKYKNVKEGQLYPLYPQDYVIKAMTDFVALKCKEQREICAEKADADEDSGYCFVNKDSILNASEPIF